MHICEETARGFIPQYVISSMDSTWVSQFIFFGGAFRVRPKFALSWWHKPEIAQTHGNYVGQQNCISKLRNDPKWMDVDIRVCYKLWRFKSILDIHLFTAKTFSHNLKPPAQILNRCYLEHDSYTRFKAHFHTGDSVAVPQYKVWISVTISVRILFVCWGLIGVLKTYQALH